MGDQQAGDIPQPEDEDDGASSFAGSSGSSGSSTSSDPSASGQQILGSGTVAPDGTFVTLIQVPADAQPGDFAVALRGLDGAGAPREVIETLRVIGLEGASATSLQLAEPATVRVWHVAAAMLILLTAALLFFGPIGLPRRLTARRARAS